MDAMDCKIISTKKDFPWQSKQKLEMAFSPFEKAKP